MSLRIPNPNSLRARDEKISFAVDFDAVWNSVVLAARFLAEDTAVGQASVCSDIVDADVALGGVVDIKTFAIGRKGQAFGLREIFGQEAHAALVVISDAE